MYEVIVHKRARKRLKKIPQPHKERIFITLIKLRHNPRAGKALRGELSDLHSLRVWPYRIIYQIKDKKLIVYVLRIDHHQSVYQGIR